MKNLRVKWNLNLRYECKSCSMINIHWVEQSRSLSLILCQFSCIIQSLATIMKIITYILVLTLLVFTYSQYSQPQIEVRSIPSSPLTSLYLQVGQATIGEGYQINKGYSAQQLAVREIKGKYLSFDFTLARQDQWQAVNISITLKESDNVLINCSYDGMDSCYLPQDLLKSDSVLNIGIHCTRDCLYNFNTYWSDLEHMSPGDDIIFMFGKSYSQLYHVELGKHNDIQEIRIHLTPRVARKPFENAKIYGKFGTDSFPTVEDYDFKSIHLWQDGEGIFLTKQKLRSRSFMILILGQAETTYRLTCEKITKLPHQIANGEHVYEYLEAKSTKHYHLSFNASLYQEYSFRFSILSGDVKASYYVDEAMLTKYIFDPFEYMKDSEYIFQSPRLTEVQQTGLYIEVQTAKRDATYTLKFTPRKKADPVQLNEHIYGFIWMQQTKFAYFNLKRWTSYEVEKNLRFTVSLIQVLGKATPEFRVCKSTLQSCTDEALYEWYSTVIASPRYEYIAEKQIYSLQIADSFLKSINAAQKQALIIVRLFGSVDNTQNVLVALQFLNKDKMMYLREGRPFEEKVVVEERLVYKYINSDPDVKQIRVHFNQIVGHIKFEGYVKQNEMTSLMTVQPGAGIVRFTQNLTRPIFIGVNTLNQAIYSVCMQIIHKSKQNDNIDLITTSEDLTYTIKIPPSSYTLFQVIPIYHQFFFKYSASQSVVACIVNAITNQCIDENGNSLQLPKMSFKGVLTFRQGGRMHRVKITNPFSDLTAEVTVLFHSRLLDYCDYKKIGYGYSETVKEKVCFSFLLQDSNPHPVNIYVSEMDYSSLSYSIILCGTSIRRVKDQKKVTITQEVIYQMCHLSPKGNQISIVWSVSAPDRIKVDFLLHYQTQVSLLLEGVRYLCRQKAKQGELRRFGFTFLNKQRTKIRLIPIRGYFYFFVKVINTTDIHTANISHVDYHLKSSFFIDQPQTPLIVIGKDDIIMTTCIDCSLLISVHNMDEIGREVQFQIQVVQKFYNLKDRAVVSGYLEANSLAYYTYHVIHEENINFIFLLSDHSGHCANMYLGLSEDVGPKVHIAKSITNQLLFNHIAGEETKYFLALEATIICNYSISVVSIDSLEIGKPNFVKLHRGEVKYFTFDNNSPEPFKIISCSKFGDIKLYLNKSDLEINRNSFRFDELDIKKFEVVSEKLNTLAMDNNHPEYCEKCSYLVGVEALRNTEASLYVIHPSTIVPFTTNQFFYDNLERKGLSTFASYNKIEKTKLHVIVHQGEVQISAIYKQKSFSQIFTTDEQIQTMVINVEADHNPVKEVKQLIPINFVMTANSDQTSYSLLLTTISQTGSLSEETVYQQIWMGQSNHVTIESSTPLCLQGYVRDMQEQIYIATNTQSKSLLDLMIIQQRLDEEIACIKTSVFKNIMVIKLAPTIETFPNVPYQLCLQLSSRKTTYHYSMLKEKGGDSDGNEESNNLILKAVVSQTNSINYLPSYVSTPVNGSNTYIVYSEGEFLLNIFQCQGEAKLKYATSMKKLNNSQSQSLSYLGMNDQPHAIKMTQKQTSFIQVDSPYSIISWIPIDYQTDKGTGYMAYSKGDLKYQSNFTSITILFQSLQKVKESKSKIEDIDYTLYLADDPQKLEAATQCDSGYIEGVHAISYIDQDLKTLLQNGNSSLDYLQFPIQKSFLFRQYGIAENIYFNVIAKLTLKPNTSQSKLSPSSEDDYEHYRLIYSRKQIPLEIYQTTLKGQIISYVYLISSILLLTLVIIIIAYVFIIQIVPGRLKNRNLVEQASLAVQDNLEVPNSSDFNPCQQNTGIEKQQSQGK